MPLTETRTGRCKEGKHKNNKHARWAPGFWMNIYSQHKNCSWNACLNPFAENAVNPLENSGCCWCTSSLNWCQLLCDKSQNRGCCCASCSGWILAVVAVPTLRVVAVVAMPALQCNGCCWANSLKRWQLLLCQLVKTVAVAAVPIKLSKMSSCQLFEMVAVGAARPAFQNGDSSFTNSSELLPRKRGRGNVKRKLCCLLQGVLGPHLRTTGTCVMSTSMRGTRAGWPNSKCSPSWSRPHQIMRHRVPHTGRHTRWSCLKGSNCEKWGGWEVGWTHIDTVKTNCKGWLLHGVLRWGGGAQVRRVINQ